MVFDVPSGKLTVCYSLLLKMAIEIVDLPIQNDGSFHSFASLPEGKPSYIPLNHIKSPLNPIKSPLNPIKSPFSYGFPMLSHSL